MERCTSLPGVLRNCRAHRRRPTHATPPPPPPRVSPPYHAGHVRVMPVVYSTTVQTSF